MISGVIILGYLCILEGRLAMEVMDLFRVYREELVL
jgi:hypothetical protein